MNPDPLKLAEETYRQMIDVEPSFEAYLKLGDVYQKQRLYEKSVAVYLKGIELNPDSVEIYTNLGKSYEIIRQLDRALDSYNMALKVQPDCYPAIAGVASILEKRNDHSIAYSLLEPIVQNLNKDNAEVANIFANTCSSNNKQGKGIDVIKRLLNLKDLTQEKQKHLNFSLGRLYDELNKYEEAFNSFYRGNELHDEYFDEKINFEFIKRIARAFSSANFKTSSNNSKMPVFIVGMPRSGTSLVEQIIASHPHVYGAGELNDISELIHSLPQLIGKHFLSSDCDDFLTQKVLDELAEKYLIMLERKAGVASITKVVDKMPSNYLYLGFIKRILPQSTIIHCVRNPLDTCLSCYFQNFIGYHPYAYNLKDLGVNYRQYQYMMDFYQNKVRIPMLEIHYEELVKNQAELSRHIIEFCGLEWDETCLEFYNSRRVVHTASFQQVRKPMYSTSISRWKNYENYLAPLKEGLATDIK